MRYARTMVVATSAWLALTGATALASTPKTTATSKVFFLSQVGCGSTAEKAQLLPKPGDNDTTGCGNPGGVPLSELEHQAGVSLSGDKYVTTAKMAVFKLDASKKVTGQLAAGTWLVGGGGVGTVTWDVHLTGDTTKDDTIDFGKVTVSAAAAPTQSEVTAPFSLTVPKAANGVKIAAFTLTVLQRGLNAPMSAKVLGGESFVIIPAKK